MYNASNIRENFTIFYSKNDVKNSLTNSTTGWSLSLCNKQNVDVAKYSVAITALVITIVKLRIS